jgi:Tol biopolymer transport system component
MQLDMDEDDDDDDDDDDTDLSIFSTSWNQNDQLDALYVCIGRAFKVTKKLDIYMLKGVSGPADAIEKVRLTDGSYNNAFPSSSPDGRKLVFRSTRDRLLGEADKDAPDRKYKNLFVMDALRGEFGNSGKAKQLTDGECTDTHCSWSPREGCGWVVFSSTRDKPKDKQGVPALDQGLDPGYFAVYLVNANDLGENDSDELPVPVRVIQSSPTLAGHINHPVFSPDMRTIVFAADLAAVSTEPVSLPLFLHSVRPYGDIFAVDLRDTEDMARNEDIDEFHRITHSRYEYSTPTWAARVDRDHDPNAKWKMLPASPAPMVTCPYQYPDGGEGWHLSGHLTIGRRCC